MIKHALELYGIAEDEFTAENYGGGLINNTWLITCKQQQYIFQKINKSIFTDPQLIDDNIHLIHDYLIKYRSGYRFIMPVSSLAGKTIIVYDNEYYRLFEFIPSKTYS
ncbi:MAG: aminoglycoside phosphotransferase family protein, partial [Parafilimonas sp.]